jgi:hypothetical protein
MPIDMDREARTLEKVLASRKLSHLRVTKRGKALTIARGTGPDSEPEARLTLVAPGVWRLDLPIFNGKWEPTPFEGGFVSLIDSALSVGRLDDPETPPDNSGDTSDPSH